MKKRIPALALAISLLLSTPALAAKDDMRNFSRSKTYENQFSDVAADSVFYDNIAALYEYGLSVGKGDGTYGVQDSMTVGQILIFAGRIRSLYRTGDPEKGPGKFLEEGQPTAMPYLLYLQDEELLGGELEELLETPATRAQVAHGLANLLPEEALPSIHTKRLEQFLATGRFLPDVTEETLYYEDILKLYRTGISIGSDAVGSFSPDATITRGAAAAMLTRMVDPTLRVSPNWIYSTTYTSAKGTTLADLVPAGTYIPAPADAEELWQSICYMLSSNSNVLELQYEEMPVAKARKIMDLAIYLVKNCCEQGYNSVTCTYNRAGYLVMSFHAYDEETPTQEYRAFTMDSAIAVHDQMWEKGYITEDMTDYEKALVYYTWICQNCEYDSAAETVSLSHLAYGLFRNGMAVCDGYTGAYNLLLKLEGIPCYALPSKTHIWTVASLDGEEVHIDTTWGDDGDTVDYTYFAMTDKESWAVHPWRTMPEM